MGPASLLEVRANRTDLPHAWMGVARGALVRERMQVLGRDRKRPRSRFSEKQAGGDSSYIGSSGERGKY